MLDDIAIDMEKYTRVYFMSRLHKLNIKILTKHKLEEITDKGVVVVDTQGNRHILEADSIILAMGSLPNKDLNLLKDKQIEINYIGDCVKPRELFEAIHEGFTTSLTI